MDLEALKQQHAVLDRRIKEGYSNYIADKNLQKMKYEKAYLKRRIQQYENSNSH